MVIGYRKYLVTLSVLSICTDKVLQFKEDSLKVQSARRKNLPNTGNFYMSIQHLHKNNFQIESYNSCTMRLRNMKMFGPHIMLILDINYHQMKAHENS